MPHPAATKLSSHLAPFEHLPIAITQRLSALPAAMTGTVDAAIWCRPLPRAVGNWLDSLAARDLPDGRYIAHPRDVAASIATLFAARGLASTPALTWLGKDIEQLSHHVCEIAGTERVRLRLERVDDNGCSRLHIDHVVARMICTYRGPGSQVGFDATAPGGLQIVPTGMPIMLKGKRWPGENPPMLKHRSPAIEGTGITRLVLVLEGVTCEDIMPDYDTFYAPGEPT
jgi:uncharacterized protein DUF1826